MPRKNDKNAFDEKQFLSWIQTFCRMQPPDEIEAARIRADDARSRRITRGVDIARAHLDKVEQRIESVETPPYVFNLLHPDTICEVIVHKILQQESRPLPEVKKFYGSGVYLFYYRGNHPAYSAIRCTDVPIYVGSKDAKLKQGADTPRKQGAELYKRIREHLERSILKTSTLNAGDFSCRYLVVQSGLELAVEGYLIRHYLPVWNKEAKVCSGLGKHGDQPTASDMSNPPGREEKSPWDILHPGRPWATHQISRRKLDANAVINAINGHFQRLIKHDRARWLKSLNEEWIATHVDTKAR